MITLNRTKQTCHKCESDNLSIIAINDMNGVVTWCNSCEERTLEGKICIDKIKNIHIDT